MDCGSSTGATAHKIAENHIEMKAVDSSDIQKRYSDPDGHPAGHGSYLSAVRGGWRPHQKAKCGDAMKQVYDAGIRTVCFIAPVFLWSAANE